MSEEGHENPTPPPFEPDEHGLVVMPDEFSEEEKEVSRGMTQESLLNSTHSKKEERARSRAPTLRKTIAISVDSPGTVPDEHIRYPNCPIVELDHSFHEYEYVIQFRESKKHSQRFLDSADDKWDSASFQEEYAVHIHMNEIYFKLKEKGLIVHVVRSERDVGLLSMLVDAPEELIERTAEMLQMELPLREELGGGWAAFDRKHKKSFKPFHTDNRHNVEDTQKGHGTFGELFHSRVFEEENPEVIPEHSIEMEVSSHVSKTVPIDCSDEEHTRFFNSAMRQRIVFALITEDSYTPTGGAGVNLDRLIEDKTVEKYFPVHHDAPRIHLLNTWTKTLFKRQPIDRIREYYGETIALFFAFLDFSLFYLILASIVGVPIYIVTEIYQRTKDQSESSTTEWPASAYSVFLAIWATVFLNFWKRKNAELNHKWNTMDFSMKESTRTTYRGRTRYGFEQDDIWIDWPTETDENGNTVYSTVLNIKPRQSRYFDPNRRVLRMFASLIPMSIMCGIVVIITICIFALRLYIAKNASSIIGSNYIGSVVNAITIVIFNAIYTEIAVILTEWENHRTQNGWDNMFILKQFIFQFVNSYTSLYYIAFFKGSKTRLFGVIGLEDSCATAREQNPFGGCVDELAQQLLIILVVNTAVNQLTSVILPVVLNSWWAVYLFCCGRGSKEHRLPKWEKEGRRTQYTQLLATEKFTQIVIQYGFIVLFAASFPIAPFIALINVILCIKTYSFQMLQLLNRPNYRCSNDIGIYYWILEILGVMAVITNCFLIGFTHQAVFKMFQRNISDFSGQALGVLIIVMALEHLLLIVKLLVELGIPDVPQKVRKDIIWQDFLHDEVYNQMAEAQRNKEGGGRMKNHRLKFITKQHNKQKNAAESQSSNLNVLKRLPTLFGIRKSTMKDSKISLRETTSQ